jgi:transmembrane sensor
VSIAAGISALGLAALVGLAGKVMWFDHTFQTHAGEWRTMPLSDGSSISAAPFTRLHHDIGDDQRLISLEQGKAVFRVAKDPSRPFLVEAGGLVITATGTQFGVESSDETVTVTMREGTVIVTPAADSEATFAGVPLAADDQLTLSGSGQPKVVHTDAERELEWERGLLKFVDGDTIGDAVAQFNDFNDIKIVVDERTSARPMRGRFDAIDPLSFADTVGLTVNASVVRESPELIRIKAAEHRR